MLESKLLGRELWLCEPVQCVALSRLFLIVLGNDKQFYPAMVIDDGMSTHVSYIYCDNELVSFEKYDDAKLFLIRS